VAGFIRSSGVALLVYAGLIVHDLLGFSTTPTGFVPGQDKQYLVTFRTTAGRFEPGSHRIVIKRMSDIALKQPGFESAVAFPGLSINGFTNSPNAGIALTACAVR
jgi:multidrug efflux pump